MMDETDVKYGCDNVWKNLMEEVFFLNNYANISIECSLSLPIYIRKMLVRRTLRDQVAD